METKVLFALFALVICKTCDGVPRINRPPHIIMAMADDMGFNDIGYTNPEVLTPHMDALAGNGLIMNKNYVVNVCTPSRTAFITGRNPHRTTMQHGVLQAWTPHCVPTDIPFLSSALQEGGYQTHLSGKWHLGSCKWGCTPNERGFDSFLGLLEGMGDYYTHEISGGFDWRRNKVDDPNSVGVYTTDLIRDQALDIIDGYDRGDKPIFMWLTFTAPHSPFQAPQSYKDLYPNVAEPRKTYLAMISSLDDAVGAIADKLKEKDMWSDTFFIFTSDNGGEAGATASNLPLRGAKGTLFEGGVRVPGFVASPLLASPGTVSDEMMYITDWYPTLLSIAGVRYDSADLDGFDQTELFLEGGASKRDTIIHKIDIEWTGDVFLGNAAIRQGDMKMIWGGPGESDGYGEDTVELAHRDEYLALIGTSVANYTDIPDVRPNEYYKSPQETANEQGIAEEIGIHGITRQQMMDGRGRVYLFNITDDPEETNDLAVTDPSYYADVILDMKNTIMGLIETDYIAPPDLAFESWFSQSAPTHLYNSWTPGWCEGVEMKIRLDSAKTVLVQDTADTGSASYMSRIWRLTLTCFTVACVHNIYFRKMV